MPKSMGGPKPACGSGQRVGEYDLPLHTAGLFLVLGASLLGAGFPVAAKKIKWLKIPDSVFFATKHFGTGVLIATAFVHLIPTAFSNLTNPCLPDLFTDDYPAMPGVIMMASLFSLFTIEMYINSKMPGGHSHGGPTGLASTPSPQALMKELGVVDEKRRPVSLPGYESSENLETDEARILEKRLAQMQDPKYGARQDAIGGLDEFDFVSSEMPPWFIVFYENYVRQRLDMLEMLQDAGCKKAQVPSHRSLVAAQAPILDEEAQQVDPMVLKKMSLNITLLEGGILFHSVFVGMTVSITIEGFVTLLVAILFHQLFEGLGLGSRIAAVPYPKGSIRPWLLVVAFGTTAPIGQAIGLLTRNSYDPNSAFGLIIVGVFNAISSGLLIYAATVDLLAEDFLSEEANRNLTKKSRITAFCYVLAGAAGMAIVGVFA